MHDNTAYDTLRERLAREPRTWLITGVAGFIGSNLLENLLRLDQWVVGLDNFATGHQRNLDEVRELVNAEQWARFHFIQGDIRNPADCQRAMHHPMVSPGASGSPSGRVDHVLHQAALGSVPRSLQDPVTSNEVNISGFLNMLVAARDAQVPSFVYAASSSTYGDHPGLPKIEEAIGKPLSPYAVTKYVNELYADVFARSYQFNTIGLRYFNVFGPRQDPNGAYAAVIPKWTAALLQGETIHINGDGETSRDFCFIQNAVQANLLAAMADTADAWNQVYNVAVGDQTSLNLLFQLLRDNLNRHGVPADVQPSYRDFRAGDVRHSLANIDKARTLLGYHPSHRIADGLRITVEWFTAPKRRAMLVR